MTAGSPTAGRRRSAAITTTTASSTTAPPRIWDPENRSPATTTPRKTAITGFTYAYVATVEIGRLASA